jgi:hypothetical protein
MTLKIIADPPPPAETPCRGRFYRYLESTFKGKGNRIVLTQELRLLKSISCPGCPKCWGLEDCLDETLEVDPRNAIQFIGPIEPGATVELTCKVTSIDYESGNADGCVFEAREVTNPPEKKA